MKNSKINKLIAEACGVKLPIRWFISIDGGETALMYFDSQEDAFEKLRLAVPCEEHTDCCQPEVWCEAKALPNYCEDLNAMHEAEKTIVPKTWDNFSETWWNYCKHLRSLPSYAEHATALDRAKAFLKTIGKWEEAK